MENSLYYLKWFADVPLTFDEYLKIKDSITKECRWYLAGKYCERVKYNHENCEAVRRPWLLRLSQELGCSKTTVRRFARYAKAIDRLSLIVPDIVSDLISGKFYMSLENVLYLAARPSEAIPEIIEQVKSGEEKLYHIFPERAIKLRKTQPPKLSGDSAPVTVKDTPKYAPDAEAAVLTFTISSWTKTISRACLSSITDVSESAHSMLNRELNNLKSVTTALIELITEA
jgi:hypothetical protein